MKNTTQNWKACWIENVPFRSYTGSPCSDSASVEYERNIVDNSFRRISFRYYGNGNGVFIDLFLGQVKRVVKI